MENVVGIGVNDDIGREKRFKEVATAFLKTLKIKKVEEDFVGNRIRDDKEIEACNKIKQEREEGRQLKEKRRKIEDIKPRKNREPKEIDAEDFVYLPKRKAPAAGGKAKRLGKSRRKKFSTNGKKSKK
jgi:hypothetical protein